MKYISLLGSTGSIGTQTLEVIKNNSDDYKVCGITGCSNIDLLEKQVLQFRPRIVAVSNTKYYRELKKRVGAITEVVAGAEGLAQVATMDESDIVMSSIVGIAGLIPTFKAIEKGKTIGLANKETLVTAGRLVMDAAKKSNSNILPVDSEHSAIFQCIAGNNIKSLSKIILTASGGPFRNKSHKELENVSIEETLNHPNWSMGRKISVDSATLMNKGLEVIEAKWLFDVNPDKIEVCVHPQSVIHSMVEFDDGAVIAQLGIADMKIPIQYSLTYPERKPSFTPKLNLFEIGTLTFEKPNTELFRCLSLAFHVLKEESSHPVVLNASNEIAVDLFLQNKISFMAISELIEDTLQSHISQKVNSIDDIIEIDAWARRKSMQLFDERCGNL